MPLGPPFPLACCTALLNCRVNAGNFFFSLLDQVSFGNGMVNALEANRACCGEKQRLVVGAVELLGLIDRTEVAPFSSRQLQLNRTQPPHLPSFDHKKNTQRNMHTLPNTGHNHSPALKHRPKQRASWSPPQTPPPPPPSSRSVSPFSPHRPVRFGESPAGQNREPERRQSLCSPQVRAPSRRRGLDAAVDLCQRPRQEGALRCAPVRSAGEGGGREYVMVILKG